MTKDERLDMKKTTFDIRKFMKTTSEDNLLKTVNMKEEAIPVMSRVQQLISRAEGRGDMTQKVSPVIEYSNLYVSRNRVKPDVKDRGGEEDCADRI